MMMLFMIDSISIGWLTIGCLLDDPGVATTVIANNANSNTKSSSYLGFSYTTPVGTYGSTEAQNFLAGSHKFTVSDYEVFQAVPL